jgi:hypothetical protein
MLVKSFSQGSCSVIREGLPVVAIAATSTGKGLEQAEHAYPVAVHQNMKEGIHLDQ